MLASRSLPGRADIVAPMGLLIPTFDATPNYEKLALLLLALPSRLAPKTFSIGQTQPKRSSTAIRRPAKVTPMLNTSRRN